MQGRLAPAARATVLLQRLDAAGGAQVSRRRFVTLRPVVSLQVRPERYEPIAGRPFVVSGRVQPAEPGVRVQLEGSAAAPSARWPRCPSAPAARSGATFTPPAGGDWRFRPRLAAVAGRRGGGAARVRLSVFGSNPHGVPAGAAHYIVQVIGEMRLHYYEDGRLLRVLPVVFGTPSTPSPVGRWRVHSRTVGPSSAFGPLVLRYFRGYGIHGTDQEYLLARSRRYYSHGRTRNHNADIRWLWPRVPVGTPVVNIRWRPRDGPWAPRVVVASPGR